MTSEAGCGFTLGFTEKPPDRVASLLMAASGRVGAAVTRSGDLQPRARC